MSSDVHISVLQRSDDQWFNERTVEAAESARQMAETKNCVASNYRVW